MDLIRIRPARPDEIPRIVELWDELMAMHEGLDPRFTRRPSANEAFEMFARHNTQSEAAIVLVAEVDGAVVGFCMAVEAELPPVFEVGPIGEIYDLVVAEHCRRRGIGRRLVDGVCNWARERGLDRVDLRASVNNPDALAFWRAIASPFLETLTINPNAEPPDGATRG
ncbi:MAG: GNAT family N-acetyltransferase [Deltaproteobacteria bacterium]|nr:GNAT family N-acetyltransferase [Deltaproteobacteria bacterium]